MARQLGELQGAALLEGRHPGMKYATVSMRRAVRHADSRNLATMFIEALQEQSTEETTYAETTNEAGETVKTVTMPAAGDRQFGIVIELTGDAADNTTQVEMETGLEYMMKTLNVIPRE